MPSDLLLEYSIEKVLLSYPKMIIKRVIYFAQFPGGL
jgi:hypothetical protein